MNQLKLTRIYFIRNKVLELLGLAVLVWLLLSLPAIGKLAGCWEKKDEKRMNATLEQMEECNLRFDVTDYDGICTKGDYSFQGFVILGIIIVIILFSILLIKWNWEWAKQQARESIKRTKRKEQGTK